MSAKSPKDKLSAGNDNHLSGEWSNKNKINESISVIKLNGYMLASDSEIQHNEIALRLQLAVEASNLNSWDWNIKTDEVTWKSNGNASANELPIKVNESFKDFIERVHREDRETLTNCVEQAMTGNNNCEVEFRLTQRQGPSRWFYMRCGAIFSDGMPEKIIGIVQDVTEKKLIEEQHEKLIAEAQAAQIEISKAKKAKEEFLNTVSHELRTPLTSIVGWAHLIRSVEMPDEQIEYALSVIERNAISQKRLIEDLLDTKRTINRSLNLKLQQTQLSRIVEAALEIVRPSAEAKKLALNYSCETSEDRIICDPAWLRQAVLNILINAVEHTPKGHIDVRVERETTGNLSVVIKDKGPGIKEDMLPFIFDSPGQLSSKQEKNSELVSGSGKLLATRNIVKLHGGTVAVSSEGENKGSTFIISLPVNADALSNFENRFLEGVDWTVPATTKQTSFKNISEEKELKDLRVLVVDDDISTSKLFEFVMAHCGAKVKSASSAAEAMQALENWQPDALVCDIGMPDIDGYTLINLIRNLPTKQNSVPAIAVTAFASEETRRRALEAGFQEYIAKPVLPEELAKAVRAIVGSKELSRIEKSDDSVAQVKSIASVQIDKSADKSVKASDNNLYEIATKNYLLSALPRDEYERLEPYMTVVSLKGGEVLCAPDEFIKYVYFPINSVASLLSITDDGTSIEAGMVGREGIIGLPVILGFDTMATWASMTVGGQAIRIGSKQLKDELQAGGKLHNLALDYTRAFITQISQTAVCNRRHSVEERLCTWLLLLQDCMGSRRLPLTQELISNRLGTRRPGISNCTRDLQKAGIIQNARGEIYIKDREGLKAAACSCYEVMKAEYDSLSLLRDKSH